MIQGEKIRYEIHKILFSIFRFNKNLNDLRIKKKIEENKKEDIAFLINVTLASMRYHLHTLKIIDKYIKKKIRDHEKILLISAITQIVFLNFKEYAVINCSVQIAKKLKLYPGLINASLKNIAKNKLELKEIKITYNDLPLWFKEKTYSITNIEKKRFLKNFYKEPDIHIVFKNIKSLNLFEDDLIKTSSISGFLLNKKNITEKKSFIRGDWWVQDFSSFFPLHNFEIKNKKNKLLDACSAPGGKAFQILSRNIKIILNDKSKNRIKILKSNLDRLRYNPEIKNKDFLKFKEDQKFDTIILDAPCSSVGTIRKNPEIFFKKNAPNLEELNVLQENMLKKASRLLLKNGFIIYMTCSFLKCETFDQIENFLKKNDNFVLFNFKLKKEFNSFSRFIDKNYMLTFPDNVLEKNIDGYFAAYLKKIK